MSDVNEIVDVLLEIRDVLDALVIQNDIGIKTCSMMHNESLMLEEKLVKYKLKLLKEIKDEEDE